MLPQQLQKILPRAGAEWIVALIEQPPKFGIDTENEIASFIAQLAHESDGLTRFEEGLNYSVNRLPQVWKRFAANPDEPPANRRPNELAHQYARSPERLANFIYAGRIGNGDEASGDGWRYRGRGPIQLTGRRNYHICGRSIGEPLLEKPHLVLTPRVGISTACWYWVARSLDAVDDDDDVLRETRIVNGGTHGLAQRQEYFDRALSVLRGT